MIAYVAPDFDAPLEDVERVHGLKLVAQGSDGASRSRLRLPVEGIGWLCLRAGL